MPNTLESNGYHQQSGAYPEDACGCCKHCARGWVGNVLYRCELVDDYVNHISGMCDKYEKP